jgi:phenylacetate-coenzyme A ligase PaaK-like adenylate-forming protein
MGARCIEKMNITPLDPWIHHKIAASQPQLTRAEIEAWQVRKLNETLALARAQSPFYRKLLAGMPKTIAGLDDLTQFPFTTPQDICRNPLQLVCVSQDEIQRVVTLQSSGTTGAPKRIYYTAQDQELTVDFFGVGMSTLTRPGERVLILLPGETPGSVGDLLSKGLQRLGMEPISYGPVYDPLHTLEVIATRQVDCLVGSPTQMLGLARRWQPDRHKPRSVLLSTDYVPAAIVKTLEQAWGCEVYNHYGATEMGLGGGVECGARRGYHLREADLYFEVINPLSGQPVQEGEYGEVVFTTLTRRGMPLIRYRMGDRSRFIPAACPCGTALKTLEKVSRRFDGFVALGEAILCLPDFDEALFGLPDLLNFSVTVIAEGALRIEAQMLNDVDVSHEIERALRTIPALENLTATIQCRYNPLEVGSLRKRVIYNPARVIV